MLSLFLPLLLYSSRCKSEKIKKKKKELKKRNFCSVNRIKSNVNNAIKTNLQVKRRSVRQCPIIKVYSDGNPEMCLNIIRSKFRISFSTIIAIIITEQILLGVQVVSTSAVKSSLNEKIFYLKFNFFFIIVNLSLLQLCCLFICMND